MGRTLKVILTNEQRLELEHGYKTGDGHAFRQRCRMVLLKSSGKLTKEICQMVGINSQNQVNIWIKRYQEHYNTLGYIMVFITIISVFFVYRVNKIVKKKMAAEPLQKEPTFIVEADV